MIEYYLCGYFNDKLIFKNFIDKEKQLYKFQVFSNYHKIVDVNNFDFYPLAGDFWDEKNQTLIPNYKKRNNYLQKKEENDKGYYFAVLNEKNNVLLSLSWHNDNSEKQNYIINAFKNGAIMKIEEEYEDFYDDEYFEKLLEKEKE